MAPTPKEHSVVAIYDSHAGAEAAIGTLQRAGLEMRQLSIVSKGIHTDEHALGLYTLGDRVKFWAGRAFGGPLWAMLFGDALFFLPTIGPVVVMGPLTAWIAGALEGAAVGGAGGALAAALASIGLPKDSAAKLECEVKAGGFLVLVHGSAGLIDKARNLLGTTAAAQLTTHVNRSGARGRAQMLLPARSDRAEEDERGEHVPSGSVLAELSTDELTLVSAAEMEAALSRSE
jgi:uncharacterized membrane protein